MELVMQPVFTLIIEVCQAVQEKIRSLLRLLLLTSKLSSVRLPDATEEVTSIVIEMFIEGKSFLRCFSFSCLILVLFFVNSLSGCPLAAMSRRFTGDQQQRHESDMSQQQHLQIRAEEGKPVILPKTIVVGKTEGDVRQLCFVKQFDPALNRMQGVNEDIKGQEGSMTMSTPHQTINRIVIGTRPESVAVVKSEPLALNSCAFASSGSSASIDYPSYSVNTVTTAPTTITTSSGGNTCKNIFHYFWC